MKIAVAGTGYVGLSIATLLAQHNQVTAVDVIPEKVDKINQRISPIMDEYIDKFFKEKNLNLTATLDGASAYRDAEFVVIAAPTNYDPQLNFFDTHHIEDVIDLANRYNVPVFSGAFSATEVFNAMRAGATMVKIFPGALGGPKYMTNLKMVFPEVNLIPSGGITPENAGEFIRCGACAVSGARTFMDFDKIEREGLISVTNQVKKFIDIIAEAKKDIPPIP